MALFYNHEFLILLIKRKIYIYDLQMSCKGIGNGNIALHDLIQFAVDHRVDLIAGCLASCDKDETYRFDLLERFYGRWCPTLVSSSGHNLLDIEGSPNNEQAVLMNTSVALDMSF